MESFYQQYTSIVPRLAPAQNTSKKIPIIDEGYGYHLNENTTNTNNNNNNTISNTRIVPASVNHSIMSMKTQSMHTDSNLSDFDNSFKQKNNKSRLHLESLKDNSGGGIGGGIGGVGEMNYPINAFDNSLNMNPTNGYDYSLFNNQTSMNSTGSLKMLIITFGVIIGLFSLTALAISIYLLIRFTSEYN